MLHEFRASHSGSLDRGRFAGRYGDVYELDRRGIAALKIECANFSLIDDYLVVKVRAVTGVESRD